MKQLEIEILHPVPMSFYLSLCAYILISLTPSLSLSLTQIPTFSLFLSVHISLSHTLSLSQPPTLSLFFSVSICLSLSHTQPPHSLSLSLCVMTISLSLSLIQSTRHPHSLALTPPRHIFLFLSVAIS